MSPEMCGRSWGPRRELGPTEEMWGEQIRPPHCPAGAEMAVEGLWEDQMQGRGKGRDRVTGGRQWGAMAKTGKVVCGGTIERIGGVTSTPLCTQDSPGFSSVSQEIPQSWADWREG